MPGNTRTPWRRIATVVKTQGLKGEVVVEMTDDLPFSIFVDHDVFFVPPALRGRNGARVATVEGDARSASVRFEGIESITDAEGLVGRSILVSRDEIPEYVADTEALIGRPVSCVDNGPLGNVSAVICTPANDVLEVQGPHGEILILSLAGGEEDAIVVKLLPGLLPDDAEGRRR